MYDYAAFAWIGVLFGIVLYAGLLALSLWVTYLIIRTAVKNGILLADRARGRHF